MSQLTISCPSLYTFLIGMHVQFLIFLWYSTLLKLFEVTSEQLQWNHHCSLPWLSVVIWNVLLQELHILVQRFHLIQPHYWEKGGL